MSMLNDQLLGKVIDTAEAYREAIARDNVNADILASVSSNMILSQDRVIEHINSVRANKAPQERSVIDASLPMFSFYVECTFTNEEVDEIFNFIRRFYSSDVFGSTVDVPAVKPKHYDPIYKWALIIHIGIPFITASNTIDT